MSAQVILCYHKVGPIAENGRRLNVESHRLASHLRFFQAHGPIVVAADLGQEFPARFTCFTFDDAYASTLNHAVPVFDRAGAKASFYAVSRLVGTKSDWDGPLAAPLASWSDLKAAFDGGHEVGNHSACHPKLTEISPDEQVRELTECDAMLRENGIVPRSVCFPYGAYNAQTLAAMDRTGHRVGLALRKRPTHAAEDRRALSRIVVAYSDGLALLLYKIHIRPGLKGVEHGV